MLHILDNTLVNLISEMTIVSVYLDIESHNNLEIDAYNTGVYDDTYHKTLNDNFTVMFKLLVVETRVGHKFKRDIVISDIIMLDKVDMIKTTDAQYKLLEQTLYKLITINNSLE